MGKTFTVAITTLGLATLAAAGAWGQDTTVVKSGADSTAARGPAPDSTAVKAGLGKPSFATLTAAVDVTPATVEKLKRRVAISANDIVLVSDRELGPNQTDPTLNLALERNATQLERLRGILNGHPNVKHALYTRQPGLTIGDIMAAEVREDGKVVVYYRGR